MGQERVSGIESTNSFSYPATGRGPQDSAILATKIMFARVLNSTRALEYEPRSQLLRACAKTSIIS